MSYLILLFLMQVSLQLSAHNNTFQKHKNFTTKEHAGIIININQQLFDMYRDESVKKFLEQMEQMEIPQVMREDQIGLLNVSTRIYNFKIKNCRFDPEGTEISLSTTKPQLNFRIVNLNMDLAFWYDVSTNPDLLLDKGLANAYIKDLTINLQMNPSIDNYFFQLDLQYIDINIKNIGIDCKGGDLAYLVNYFSDILREMIKENIVGVLQDDTVKSIQEIVNNEIKNTPPNTEIINNDLEMDLLLVDQGVIVTDKWLSIPLDGTFHPISIDSNYHVTKHYQEMPTHREDGNIVQIFVSQYTLNTLFGSIFSLNWFKYTLNQTSDNIEAMISQFEYAYGEFQECQLIVVPEYNASHPPKLVIKQEQSEIEFLLAIHLKNPIDGSMDAAKIIAKASANIVFNIERDFSMHGQLESVQLKTYSFEPYFKTTTNKQLINSKIQLIAPFIASYANNLLEQGMKLPLPKDLTSRIKNYKVQTFDGYIMVDAEPDFQPNNFFLY